MNREIKFRIWADNKFYNKCLVGNTNNTNDEKWTCPMVWLEKQKEWVHCDNGIICQYTGLHDKNGKEIYEGDIVLYQDWEMVYEGGGNDSFINKGIVEYCEDNCCFNVTERQTVDLADVLYKDNEDLEVIGNIYDNPELLGGMNGI